MDMNALIGSALIEKAAPPRDAWALGTVASAPSGGKVQVTIDGDTAPVAMSYCVSVTTGDRVLTVRLGQAVIAVAKMMTG